MSEAIALSKTQGLVRRISRGAANRLPGRRQSSNQVANRDRSSGPVLRRRSDSKGTMEHDTKMRTGSGWDGDHEPLPENLAGLDGLGLSGEGIQLDDEGLAPKRSCPQGGFAPIVPLMLQRGMTLIKVTKRKRKSRVFVFDADAARVSWDPSNPSKRLYVDDIQQIRLRDEARNYREDSQVPVEMESRWFTIIYANLNRTKGRPIKSMHLIALSQQDFELWTSTLNDLAKYRHELMAGLVGSNQDEKTLQSHWTRETMKALNGGTNMEPVERLDLEGVERLCRSLHINCSKDLIRDQFGKADASQTGYLGFREFIDFVRHLKERPDIRDVYRKLCPAGQAGIDLDVFLKFLKDIQGINVDSNRAYWVKIFRKYAQKSEHESGIDGSISVATTPATAKMDASALSAFLSSVCNSVQGPKDTKVRLDRPLNEYFISSSHNTYLLGRQFAGSSSVEAYIRALQKACRCVEIDCWDGPDGRPIVLHGHTMTSKVSFADCISVIGKYAFVESPYPLILSLEVHCNAQQQQVMVDIMIDELGDRLIQEPCITNAFSLPSPEELRYKILVKVKAGGDPVDCANSPGRTRERAISSPFSRPLILDNSTIPSGPMLSNPPSMSPSETSSSFAVSRSSTTTSMSSATDDSDTVRVRKRSSRKNSMKHNKRKIIASLGKLGVYTQGIKFTDFSAAESKAYNHIISIGERRFEGLCRDQETKSQLEKHNLRYLMRIYPSGFRLKSTNPDPLVFWRRGAQMVALNWQTYDLGMQLNEAMFACESDQSGYVLKPRELRHPSLWRESSDDGGIGGAFSGSGPICKKLICFSVEMISAQQLPQPRNSGPDDPLDPYVEIEMFSAEDQAKGVASGEGGLDASAPNGMSGIGLPHRRRTHVVHNNGYNPIFNANFKLFLETKHPDLVFVRWTVWNAADGRKNTNADPLATFTAKLSRLGQGYRHLPLYDHNGDQFLFATLFCKIKKEEPIAIASGGAAAAKPGRFRQLSFLKRTLSVEKRSPRVAGKKSSLDTMRSNTFHG